MIYFVAIGSNSVEHLLRLTLQGSVILLSNFCHSRNLLFSMKILRFAKNDNYRMVKNNRAKIQH